MHVWPEGVLQVLLSRDTIDCLSDGTAAGMCWLSVRAEGMTHHSKDLGGGYVTKVWAVQVALAVGWSQEWRLPTPCRQA